MYANRLVDARDLGRRPSAQLAQVDAWNEKRLTLLERSAGSQLLGNVMRLRDVLSDPSDGIGVLDVCLDGEVDCCG